MASFSDILRTLQLAIQDRINADGVQTPGEVVVGWPIGNQLEGIIGSGQWLVTLFPGRARPVTRYRPQPMLVSQPATPTLTATVTPGLTFSTLSLSGANEAGLNIHTVVGPRTGTQDTLIQTTGAEQLTDLANMITAKVNTLLIPGITATQVGSTVQITGAFPVWCNIGHNGFLGPLTAVMEVARFTRSVQVDIWAASPDEYHRLNDGNRENLERSVSFAIGGVDRPFLFAPDGASFLAQWASLGQWIDDAESSYSVFRSSSDLAVEYGLLKPVATTPIGVIITTTQLDDHPPVIEAIGGFPE